MKNDKNKPRQNKPRQYQIDAVKQSYNWFQNGLRGVYIADETGVGKTPQALFLLKKLIRVNQKKLILIILPSFLRTKWIAEIKKFLPSKRKYSILITTYSEIISPQVYKYFTQFQYEYMIFDEAHYLKDFNSKRTQAVLGQPGMRGKPLIKCAKNILALSATPFPNRVGEIYTWLWAVSHPMIRGITYEDFLYQWAEKIWHSPQGIRHSGIKNPKQFNTVFKKCGFIRRKKHDVMRELPPGTRTFIPIECTAKMYKEEQEILTELLELAGFQGYELETILNTPQYFDTLLETLPSFEQFTVFKRRQGLFKVKPIFDHLKNFVLPESQKFILFTFHTDVAEKYLELFQTYFRDLPVNLITGQIKPDDRYEIINKNKNLDKHILIASMHSIKEGLDLNEYPLSFFSEIDWAPYLFTQCEGRTLRYGQTQPVFWNYYQLDKGIESYIYNIVLDKQKTIEQILN